MDGHTSKTCDKKASIVCYRCFKPGHKSNEFWSDKFKTGATTSTTSQKNTTGGTKSEVEKQRPVLQLGSVITQNKYFKEAIVNGERIQSYIDMGAACVAMRKSEVDRLGIIYDRDICEEFVGYGFGKVKAIGCFKITIIIDRVSAYVPVKVIPDEVQEISLLVGHPFTEQPHIMIN